MTRTDEELLLDLRGGNSDALAALVARWEQPLFRFVFRMLERREESRDICQETFVRVLRNASSFREGARFSTWMYQIALNLCRDHERRRRRWSFLLAEAPVSPDGAASLESTAAASDDASPSSALERQEVRRAVQAALLGLSAEHREVLVLKEYEGMKFREIAELLGCPESTVKSRMYHALSQLKTSLAREGVR